MKITDFIAILGVLMFAVVFAIDQLAATPMEPKLYIILVAVAMILVIVGAIVARRNHKM